MLIQHDYYEELCAAAVSGEIAQDELTALTQHTQECAECLAALSEYRQITCPAIWLAAAEQFPAKTDPAMTARFIARARTEGVPLVYKPQRPASRRWFPYVRFVAEFAGIALIYILGSQLLAKYWTTNQKAHNEASANQVVKPDLDVKSVDLIHRLEVQSATRDDELNQFVAELISKEKKLEVAKLKIAQVNTRMSNLEHIDKDLQSDLTARDAQIAGLRSDDTALRNTLQAVQAARGSQQLVLQANQSEIEGLRAQLRLLNEQIDQGQELSAAAEQAKELIVARHLHIVDVHDHLIGRKTQPFGRIFYVENKKLIFYAYDLADSRNLSKISFVVWGEKSGATDEPKHLGIFRSDDTRDGRWVVAFDDPHVLAEINTIFVTAESSKKDVTKPSGTRMLEAFISGQANHP